MLPFFLRIGMDSYVARRQPVLEIYREWRWGSAIKNTKSRSTIVFENRRNLNTDESLFLAQLQRDFKVVHSGQYPAVRAYIEKGTIVRAHIEVLYPGAPLPDVWTGDARFPNNGILLGIWLGLLLIFLGVRVLYGLLTTAGVTLLWSSHWNVLDIPRLGLEFMASLYNEIWGRIRILDLDSIVLGGLAELSVFVWALVILGMVLVSDRIKVRAEKIYLYSVLAAVLLEPVFLMVAARWAQWPDGTSWWKVYLGSFSYRFMTFGMLFFILLRPFTFKASMEPKSGVFNLQTIVFMLGTLVFVMCQGWAWLSSVIIEELPESILRLKIFLIGFVVSVFMGARVFSLWFSILAVATALPPTRGHWNAAAVHGALMEGLAWGWFVSPFKLFGEWRPLNFKRYSLYIVLSVSWLLGTFLSSVGFPMGVCWLVLALALWAYRHIDFADTPEPKTAP